MPLARVIDRYPISHGALVQGYFLHDAPVMWTCDVYTLADITVAEVSAAVDQAITDGAKILIYADAAPWAHKAAFARFFAAGGMAVVAHGSNSNTRITDPPGLVPYLVTVGGEDLADGSATDDRSYGPGLMLDAVAWDGLTEQSWATPTVAAALAYLYDRLARWDEAVSALLSLVSGGAEWAEQTGYGVYVAQADTSQAVPGVYPTWYVEQAPTPGLTLTRTDSGVQVVSAGSGYAHAYVLYRVDVEHAAVAQLERGAADYTDATADEGEAYGYRMAVLMDGEEIGDSEWVYTLGAGVTARIATTYL